MLTLLPLFSSAPIKEFRLTRPLRSGSSLWHSLKTFCQTLRRLRSSLSPSALSVPVDRDTDKVAKGDDGALLESTCSEEELLIPLTSPVTEGEKTNGLIVLVPSSECGARLGL